MLIVGGTRYRRGPLGALIWAAGLVSALAISVATASTTPVAPKNMTALLRASGVVLPALRTVRVNGVTLIVAEASLRQPTAAELAHAVQQLAASQPDWRVPAATAERVVLSRWVGAEHEVVSLRALNAEGDWIANYSRQDLRKPVTSIPAPPLWLSARFSRLSVVEEQSGAIWQQTFVYTFAGSVALAERWVTHALRDSGWQWEGEPDAEQRNIQQPAVGRTWFAARGDDRLRAVVVGGPSRARLVLQVGRKR